MFLTAMGYNANVFGLLGNDWETNTNRYANEAGLYEDLGDVAVSQPISRDDAAQMAYNAIQATMMNRSWNQDMQTGQIAEVYEPDSGKTLFTEKFNGDMYEGILLGTGKYNITNLAGQSTSDGNATAGRFSFLCLKVNDGELFEPTEIATSTANGASVMRMTSTEDLSDMVGLRVKVVAGQSNNVYGVFPMDEENTVIETVYGKLKAVDAETIEIDGTEYAISANATLEIGEAGEPLTGKLPTTAVKSAAPVKAISYDGDDEIDLVLVTPITEAVKVSYVSSTSFTARNSYDKADVIYPEDLAKDDIVISYKNYYEDKDQFEVLETVTGKVAASRGADTALTDVQIDGTWYPVAAAVTGGTSSTAISAAYNKSDSNALERNSTYTIAVYNGYAVWSKLDEAASTDIALVIGVADGRDANGAYQTKLLLADGTTVTEPAKDVTKTADSDTTLVTANGQPTVAGTKVAADSGKYGVYDKGLVTYEVNDDGVYELTAVVLDQNTADEDNTNLAGYDAMGEITSFNKTDKELKNSSATAAKVDENAVVFVKYADGGNKFTVLTGAELNDLTDDFGTFGLYLYNNSGLEAAQVVLLVENDMLPGISASKNIGYVMTTPYDETVSSVNYQVFDLWTDEGLMEDVRLNKTSEPNVAQGDFISFDLDADKRAVNVNVANDPVAIVGYSENSSSIRLTNGGYNNQLLSLADTTKIIFVNTATDEGIEGGEVSTAVSPASGVYYSNAKVLLSSGKVEFICVDVANEKWDGAETTNLGSGVTGTTIKGLQDGASTCPPTRLLPPMWLASQLRTSS